MTENKKKIAVFVEGQGELIFFRNMIFHLLGDIAFSFQCLKLHSGQTQEVPYTYSNPDAKVHFMIINVENDTKVLSVIKEREKGLLQKGYSKIIGLRDMYSEAYRKRSDRISETVNNQFIKSSELAIQSMSEPEKVSLHFSIMEIEAWWLSMYSIFEKKDSRLTVDYINENLGFKLDEIDPERHFFHPAVILNEILVLIGGSYKKKFSDVESITNSIDAESIELIISSENKYESFRSFITEIHTSVT